MFKKITLSILLISPLFAGTVFAQQAVADTPITNYVFYSNNNKPTFSISGRVLGMNLENVQGVTVLDICTAEKAVTDNHGLYTIGVCKGDTLAFLIPKYSVFVRGFKSPKDNGNMIMIKLETDKLPANYSPADYRKAEAADNKLLHILEKDAKVEGKWNY